MFRPFAGAGFLLNGARNNADHSETSVASNFDDEYDATALIRNRLRPRNLMKHVFISHAGANSDIAHRLAGDLRNASHETKVDVLDLGLGDNVIAFMNSGIADAGTVVILYSIHTENAKWQKLEIDSAVWNEVAQDGGVCIVVRLDDTRLPPLLGPKVWGKLNLSKPKSYPKLLEDLCRVIVADKTASSVVADAFGCESANPFRRLRAEYFEDRPDLHARTFAPLDATKTGSIEEIKPTFLEGSRGTGKSMLLLSLRSRNLLSRGKGQKIFGFYLKLSRGAMCNVGVAKPNTIDPSEALARFDAQVTDIGEQEMVVCLLESLFSELSFCVAQKLLPCEHAVERVLVESAECAMFGAGSNKAGTFEDLLERLADTHATIANYIRRRFIYDEAINVPIATFDLHLLKRVLRLAKKHIAGLGDSMFVVLLDEYENLFRYQQKIVNGFVKFGPPDFSVKIAKKLGSADTSATTTGQELQEIHDFTRVPLVYDVEDVKERGIYHDLLKHIVGNIIRTENLEPVDVHVLLPEDTTHEVDPIDLKQEVAKLCKVTTEEFQRWPEERQREKLTYYGEAATYRVLYRSKGKHRLKRFSGFNELAFVSSGVIRYFQEILGVAYHLTYGPQSPPGRRLLLPPESQTKAVHFVSQHNLTTLSRNVEQDGEAMKYLLLDLGDCLRHKLLKHTSEPEAARLTIEDPEKLEQLTMEPLKRLLIVGTREGVFQTKEGLPAFKPRHRSDPQPSEFNISRIYAPVLQISARLRWRTEVTCAALLGLASPEARATAMQSLKAAIVKVKPPKPKEQQDRLL